MVGQRTMVTKPSRSDEVPDAEEQLKIADQVRARFDSLAPKRPLKPNRSEPDSSTSPIDSSGGFEHAIPELDKLRSLQSQSPEGLFAAGSGSIDVQHEFVETQYYKELESIDKQHHATGSGFIRALGEGCQNGGYDIRCERDGFENGWDRKPAIRSNPATNDWVPSDAFHQDYYVSTKPNRSESS